MFAELGTALRALRASARLTQAEVARKAGIGKGQLSKYERGKEWPHFVSLEKLLKALDAEPITLFYTAHLMKNRAEISPAAILITTTPLLGDPALETLRTTFGHLLKTFEILIASRYLKGIAEPEIL